MAWRAQGRTPRRPEGALAPWLSFAAAVHVGLFLVALAAKQDAALTSRAAADGARDPIWLDLITDSVERAPPNVTAVEPVAEQPVAEQPAPNGAAPSPSSVARPAAIASASSGLEAVPEASGAMGGVEGSAPGAEGSGARLSLRDLGVDRGSNPFIASVTDLPTERQLLNQRLRQSLRAELAQRDQARGLGPEGPAVSAVTQVVMASATAPNTTALLRVRTNGAGAVTLVDVLEADRDSDEWQRIARELVRALAGKKLRVPHGSNGVSFQLRVVSRTQLPSGADPGLSVDVLGIPLKKGDGPRSTKISILSPMIQEIEVPGSDGLRLPVVAFSLIGGVGDAVDIGAVARRLVTAYLVAMDTDALPESAAPAAPSQAAPAKTAPAAP